MDKNIVFIFVFCLILAALISLAYKLLGVDKVREWLVWACLRAEQQFGNGTGQLKLRYVYDLFTEKFPKLQIIIPFSLFSKLVDEALITVRKMLLNEKISEIINFSEAIETEKTEESKKGDEDDDV